MKYLFILLLLPFTAIAQVNNPGDYCRAPDNYGSTGSIIHVGLGSLLNPTGMAQGNPHYTYYNNITPPVLFRDSVYTLTVTFDSVLHSVPPGFGYTDNSWFRICITFNSDTATNSQFFGIYSFDTSGSVHADSTPTTIVTQVTVPHLAGLGICRMRIVRYAILNQGSTPFLCHDANPSWGTIGETEDYDLNIQDAPTFIQNINTTGYSISPNPTRDRLRITGANKYEISVFSPTGSKLLSSTSPDIDMSGLPNGIYYIEVNNAFSVIEKQ